MINFLKFQPMILPPEYNWLESYLSTDNFWIDEALNWDEAFDLIISDFSIYSFLTTSFFFNVHFFTDFFVKISFLDILLIFETNYSTFSKELYDAYIWDISTTFSNKFLPSQFFFYTDYQDLLIILLYYSPELIMAFENYVNIYWLNAVINHIPAIVFDLFSDSVTSVVSEFLEYSIMFFSFIWAIILFMNLFRLLKWNNPLEVYATKLILYLQTISRETRTQLETFLQAFFFFFIYWSMLIATFDDNKEEALELFNTGFFYFFCILIFFLLYKYSIHYFAFLEASVTEGKSVSFVTKQFFRDFINTFALFLRFFILLFRLNVYDTLDDFYDSYYIYVGDFDDDEYVMELFFSFKHTFFYDYDVNDDRAYSFEEENDLIMDFFYIYYLCWTKLFLFILFILEEILRLSLAFYICYLIVFEVHSVNCTYIEDNFFQTVRNKSICVEESIQRITKFKF